MNRKLPNFRKDNSQTIEERVRDHFKKPTISLISEARIRKLADCPSNDSFEAIPVLSACFSKCPAFFKNVFLLLIKHPFGNRKALH